jgi:hypothetical protein
MDTKFLRNANTFQLVDKDSLNVFDKLPGGNYVIRKDPNSGALYLQMVENFMHPPKMYGDVWKQSNRILQTFGERPAGTGVLLSGEKGSGKTLLARTVCIEGAKVGIPTIIINAAWHGDQFFSFITSITQPCVLLFDEFEKVYDTKKNEQDHILTLLDGAFQTKKLFLLTCNDKHGINYNMLNRPGRVFYAMEFHGLDPIFIKQYTEDNLNNKEQVESVIRVSALFAQFNFDMLKALIEEMNRYDEPASAALSMLNVSPERDFADYKVNVLLGSGEAVMNEHTHPRTIRSPLSMKDGIPVSVYTKVASQPTYKPDEPMADEHDDEGKPLQGHELLFYPTDMISIKNGTMVLRNSDGDILNLVLKKATSSFNWRNMADDDFAV